MKKLCLILGLFPFLSFAAVPACSGRPNVFLLTLDGIRSHEFFSGTSSFYFNRKKIAKDERGVIFKKFWQTNINKGALYGNNGLDGRYEINSDVAISLPSYQGMMVGKDTPCRNNGCERITETSLPERLKKELQLSKNELVVFTSWQDVSRAVESVPGSLDSSFGPEGFDDGTFDPIFGELSREAVTDLPAWAGAKKDKYTIEMALHHLEKHCPRFTYLSLNDSDEYGHENDYQNYVQSLRSYDELIDRIIKKLESMGDYGKNTTLLVTTDHSRAPFFFWTTHAITKNGGKSSFLYLYGRGVPALGRLHKIQQQNYNHDWLRPTIEHLMGVKPINPDKVLPFISF